MKRVLGALWLALPAVCLAADPPAALTRYRCYVCHADHETLVGPAFEDVAYRRRGQPGAVSDVARQIREGVRSGGPWHMPPHPEVSPQDARAMARYIMSLRSLPASQGVDASRETGEGR